MSEGLTFSHEEGKQEVAHVLAAMEQGGWKPTRKVVERLVDHLRDALKREGRLDAAAGHLDQMLREKDERHAKELATIRKQSQDYIQQIAR